MNKAFSRIENALFIIHNSMEPLQLLLTILGLAISAGGVLLLVRSMRRPDTMLRPYLPFATIAVGLAIAYRSYSDFQRLDGQDITIMFVFVLALFSLLGLQFFVVDKHKPRGDEARRSSEDE